MARHSFQFVTQEALTADELNAQDYCLFHAFNPNGVAARKREMDDAIAREVNAGRAKPGAHIAYGSFNDFGTNMLSQQARRKRVNPAKVIRAVQWIERDIAKAKEFINGL